MAYTSCGGGESGVHPVIGSALLRAVFDHPVSSLSRLQDYADIYHERLLFMARDELVEMKLIRPVKGTEGMGPMLVCYEIDV